MSEQYVVIKFGGKSLANGALILNAAKEVAEEVRSGKKVIIVVSAMGETTDQLLKICGEACERRMSAKELDEILSMGERTSARIFAASLNAQGIKARYFDPAHADWSIITDESFMNANVKVEESAVKIREHVLPLLEKGIIPVIPGFVGRSSSGEITTLGRGGSDITALVLAGAVGAKSAIFVTDVSGISSADPKFVKNPRLIEELTVERLLELSDIGSKFIHGRALKYKKEETDIKVTSYTSTPLGKEGTVVKGTFPELEVSLLSEEPVMFVTVIGQGLVDSGVATKVIDEVKSLKIPLYGVTANQNSILVYLKSIEDTAPLERIHSIVESHKEALAMAVRKNLALIRVKGVGLEEKPGIVGSISEPFHRLSINIFGMFTIASSIFVLVDWNERDRALRLIRDSLGISG